VSDEDATRMVATCRQVVRVGLLEFGQTGSTIHRSRLPADSASGVHRNRKKTVASSQVAAEMGIRQTCATSS